MVDQYIVVRFDHEHKNHFFFFLHGPFSKRMVRDVPRQFHRGEAAQKTDHLFDQLFLHATFASLFNSV